MLLTVSLALAGHLNVVDHCRWNKPGADRYTGNLVAAVDHYGDIPPAIRDRLKQRVSEHRYDDVVSITRDAIRGQHAYDPEITGMHFGEKRVCQQVSRKRWTPQRKLTGLVYCEEGYCLMVPTICGNLSRVQRQSDEPLDIEPAAGPPPAAAQPAAAPPVEPVTEDLAGLPPTEAGPPETFAAGPEPTFVTPIWPGPPPYVWIGPLVPPVVTNPPVPGIPEPAAWAQLLAGVAVLGGWLALRQRRLINKATALAEAA